MKKTTFFSLFFIALLFTNCNKKDEKETFNKESRNINQTEIDSVELTKLIRNVYKWHNENTLEDFPYKYDKNQDSIFIGIDWEKYYNNIQLFKQTKFFNEDFFEKHKDIATTIDTSIKKADITWRNINDGIPLWETGADNWCGCQDYPEEYWKTLTIDSLIINEKKAKFIWTWDTKLSHSYKVTAKKEDGMWKINSLGGFEYFFTVNDYDKMMMDKSSE